MSEERRPTVPQVYALAGALCARADEPFPETRAEASALIEPLRRELGHPAFALEDAPRRSRRKEPRRKEGGGRRMAA
ncbi:MAG: hypothetical protein H0V68_10015 [Actinobacteria bacterium]|nr:hypothetical protein [Actinomycetota bacterium]